MLLFTLLSDVPQCLATLGQEHDNPSSQLVAAAPSLTSRHLPC